MSRQRSEEVAAEFLHMEEEFGDRIPGRCSVFPTIQREQTGSGEQGKVQDGFGAADIFLWE